MTIIFTTYILFIDNNTGVIVFEKNKKESNFGGRHKVQRVCVRTKRLK